MTFSEINENYGYAPYVDDIICRRIRAVLWDFMSQYKKRDYQNIEIRFITEEVESKLENCLSDIIEDYFLDVHAAYKLEWRNGIKNPLISVVMTNKQDPHIFYKEFVQLVGNEFNIWYTN